MYQSLKCPPQGPLNVVQVGKNNMSVSKQTAGSKFLKTKKIVVIFIHFGFLTRSEVLSFLVIVVSLNI